MKFGGAQGGSLNSNARGGYGGYSQGIIKLSFSETIYVCVGGQGSNESTDRKNGGYNGGGGAGLPSASYKYNNSTGGGATHIGLKDGLLKAFSSDYNTNLLLVGGGGGGGTYRSQNQIGGDGGGYLGKNGINNYNSSLIATGGSQTSCGISRGLTDQGGPRLQPGFGYGGDGTESNYSKSSGYATNNRVGCGGGSGFYGGGGASPENASGAGGSGYINTSKLTNAFMYGYNVSTSSATTTKTYSTTNVSSTPTSNYAKSGDGAARITPIN